MRIKVAGEGREALPRAPLKTLFEKRVLRIPKNFPKKGYITLKRNCYHSDSFFYAVRGKVFSLSLLWVLHHPRKESGAKLSFRCIKKGTAMFAVPNEGNSILMRGKFLKILKKLFSKSFLSGCGQSPRPLRPHTAISSALRMRRAIAEQSSW